MFATGQCLLQGIVSLAFQVRYSHHHRGSDSYENQNSLYALSGKLVSYWWNLSILYWCNIVLNGLINVVWLHCLNLQVYLPMAHGNSSKCIIFAMYINQHLDNKWSHRRPYTTIKERSWFVTLHCSRSLLGFHALLKPSRDVATCFQQRTCECNPTMVQAASLAQAASVFAIVVRHVWDDFNRSQFNTHSCFLYFFCHRLFHDRKVAVADCTQLHGRSNFDGKFSMIESTSLVLQHFCSQNRCQVCQTICQPGVSHLLWLVCCWLS